MASENNVDTLMDLDPLDLTAEHIDGIIAYHRKNRANAAAGIKPKREAGPKIDISSIMQGLTQAGAPVSVPSIRRR
jgi:hypothetical protein